MKDFKTQQTDFFQHNFVGTIGFCIDRATLHTTITLVATSTTLDSENRTSRNEKGS